MIVGRVVAGCEPVVSVTIHGSHGRSAAVEMVIDTGFVGELALPSAEVATLQLRRVSFGWYVLADGSRVGLARYHATADWHAGPRRVVVVACEGSALLGMRLLRDCDLAMRVVAGGEVTIAPVR